MKTAVCSDSVLRVTVRGAVVLNPGSSGEISYKDLGSRIGPFQLRLVGEGPSGTTVNVNTVRFRLGK